MMCGTCVCLSSKAHPPSSTVSRGGCCCCLFQPAPCASWAAVNTGNQHLRVPSTIMPLIFSRAFCSCKGGCGKTTLMYNCACAHATSNPDHHVMMLDFSETGDISTLALGGFIGHSELGGKGKAMADAYSSKSMATTDALAAAAAACAAAPTSKTQRGFLPLFQRWSATPAQACDFQMDGKLVDLHEINPAMPSNLFISVTSPDTASNAAFDTPAKRLAVKQGLMQFFESDSRNWVIFIDTDGDRAFTHRTKMGLMLARCIAVPTDVNDNDARRMEYFSQGIREMQEAGESAPVIDVFILNKVNIVKWEPMNDESKGITSPGTPAKSAISEIDRLSVQLAAAFCRDGQVDLLPPRFVFPDMTQAGRISSSYGCPVVALRDNMARLKRTAASEGLDLSSFSVSPQLVQAVYELAAFLESVAMRDEANPRTPVKSARGA